LFCAIAPIARTWQGGSIDARIIISDPQIRGSTSLLAAVEEAERAGFDLSLVDASLRLTPEERARQQDQALALVLEFDRIRQERSEQPQPITPATC
jgi:hypothetical protein